VPTQTDRTPFTRSKKSHASKTGGFPPCCGRGRECRGPRGDAAPSRTRTDTGRISRMDPLARPTEGSAAMQ